MRAAPRTASAKPIKTKENKHSARGHARPDHSEDSPPSGPDLDQKRNAITIRGSILQAYGLTKRYGRSTVVDRLSFQVRPALVTGLLGNSGAGKSTILRMILGLTKATSGIATINGYRFAELPHPVNSIGAALDPHAFHPARTAAEHLRAIVRRCGVPTSRITEVLEIAELSYALNRPVQHFSLDMKQRLSIASALVGKPDLLVFDEPFAGLDPSGTRWIHSLIPGLVQDGHAVLIASHNANELEFVADRLLVLDHGQLLADQSLDEFKNEYTPGNVYARTPQRDLLRDAVFQTGLHAYDRGATGLAIPNTTVEQVGKVAAATGVTLVELSAAAQSLEVAFRRLTDASTHESGKMP